jgi:hypothetical protein
MIAHFVGFITAHGNDRVVWADQITHGTAHAGIARIGFLANTLVNLVYIGWRLGRIQRGLNGTLAENAQFYGIDRARCCAAAAQGAFILAPTDLPKQILNA